jgi:type I restriction enzyme S subunit
VVPAWLAYSLFSSRAQDQLLGGQYGGTKQQLGLDDLGELAIALPPREEQESRIARLEAAKRRTEATLDLLNRQLALLAEHRQALISAAVTGELEIPEVVG